MLAFLTEVNVMWHMRTNDISTRVYLSMSASHVAASLDKLHVKVLRIHHIVEIMPGLQITQSNLNSKSTVNKKLRKKKHKKNKGEVRVVRSDCNDVRHLMWPRDGPHMRSGCP